MIIVPAPTRRRALSGLFAVSVVTVAGCSAPASEADTPPGPTAEATDFRAPDALPGGWGSGAADGVFPRTVTHALGETVVPTRPQRVVVIGTGQLDSMLTLGIVPIGATFGDGDDLVPAYLRTAFPEHATALAVLAGVGERRTPNIEAIAALAPDLILLNSTGDTIEQVWATLNAIAPTVAAKAQGLYWKPDFLLVADAVGRREQAQAWLDQYAATAADAAVVGAGSTAPQSVSFLRQVDGTVRVFGLASFTGIIAADLGLTRPPQQQFSDQTSVDLSAEQLELADADTLFYGVVNGEAQTLTTLPLWPSLTAVHRGRAIEVDHDLFFQNAGPTAAALVQDAVATAVVA